MSDALSIARLDAGDADFTAALTALLDRGMATDERASGIATEIIADVRRRGDEALLEYTRRFDRFPADRMVDLAISRARMQQALEQLPARQRQALEQAADRIRAYHERQGLHSWEYTEEDGSRPAARPVTPRRY